MPAVNVEAGRHVISEILSKTQSNPIVLYDGVCGLCNHLVQFLLKRDKNDRFRFASLQSEFAQTLMMKHGVDPHDLDTVYVVKEHGQSNETLLARSDAILFMLQQLGGVWKLSGVGRVLPGAFRDAVYKIVARNRYRVFGKHESCMLPEPKHRAKFLDV
ncbi:MAG TPA: thiol-disulfide oxidoreductase DCC family protein [Pyrinomonadaceae bacterium]|nr:thiol-disulfide oxidoreductase DCC family protein [Pyrinomonadaceae bacterium]